VTRFTAIRQNPGIQGRHEQDVLPGQVKTYNRIIAMRQGAMPILRHRRSSRTRRFQVNSGHTEWVDARSHQTDLDGVHAQFHGHLLAGRHRYDVD
jgi:hypothetical protein